MSVDENEESTSENTDSSRLGEIRLRLLYMADHILPLQLYKPLQLNLLKSLNINPFCASPAGLLEYLPSVSSKYCIKNYNYKIEWLNALLLSYKRS